MSKLRLGVDKPRGRVNSYTFYCPACETYHSLGAAAFKLSGDENSPSFTPDYNLSVPGRPYRCHATIADGEIHYADDCSHALAGETVPMRDL